MISLKKVLEEALKEQKLEEAGWLKKAAVGATLAGGIMASNPTQTPPMQSPAQSPAHQGFDFTQDEQELDIQTVKTKVKTALRAVESSGRYK